MKASDCKRQAELFAALAHPVRLRMLAVLAEGEACVCHLCAALQQRQAYMSQQLARLKEAGLITDTRDGLFVYYRLANPGVMRLLREGRRAAAVVDSDGGPEPGRSSAAADCPCPKCRAAREARKSAGAKRATDRPSSKEAQGNGERSF